MTRWILAITPLLLFLTTLVAAKGPSKGKNYAFLVACGEYENDKEFGSLPFTIKELLEFRDVLVVSGEYKVEDMKVLHNEVKDKSYLPKRKRIILELDNLLNRLNEEDTLLVVFNGHGIQPKDDPSAYFCPIDASVEDIKSCIPLEGKGGLFEKLKDTKLKRKLLIVNACRDDPNKPTMAARKVDLFDKKHAYESPTGIAALFSCQPGQFSYYYPDEKETKGRQRSLFFHHLIEGWQGKYSAGKEINLEDVFGEVRTRTSREADSLFHDSQVPFMRREYAKEWTIARGKTAVKKKGDDSGSGQRNAVKFITSKTFPDMKLMRIKAGTFTMGSPAGEKDRSESEKQHEVKLTKDYYMGEHTVTVGQFYAFQSAQDAKDRMKPSFNQDDDHPMVYVNYEDAKAFCEWLSKKEDRTYRLPTEAEWEFACRGGTKTAYWFGEEIASSNANFGNHEKGTTKVSKYKPNAFGLYDMPGNVWQWCSDWYGDYPWGSVTDPSGVASGSYRILRGGSWDDGTGYCRAACRGRFGPSYRASHIGFRLSCSVVE